MRSRREAAARIAIAIARHRAAFEVSRNFARGRGREDAPASVVVAGGALPCDPMVRAPRRAPDRSHRG